MTIRCSKSCRGRKLGTVTPREVWLLQSALTVSASFALPLNSPFHHHCASGPANMGLSSALVGDLISRGVVMGIVHVLSGKAAP